MRPANRAKDDLVRDLAPVAEFAARASRAEAGGVRDDDLLEADAIGLLKSTRYLKKGLGSRHRDDRKAQSFPFPRDIQP
jgi:hypothetical protein